MAGVFGVLYAVRLDSGQCKPAVPEDEMYDASNADDPSFGAHLQEAMAAMMEEAMLDQMQDGGRLQCFDSGDD